MRLARTVSDTNQEWMRDNFPSTTISDAWAGVRVVFGEWWMQDTVMEDSDLLIDNKDEIHNLWVHKKKTLRFAKEGSNLKSGLISRRKGIDSTHIYSWPRFNLKPHINEVSFALWCSKHIFSSHYPSSFNNSMNSGQQKLKHWKYWHRYRKH